MCARCRRLNRASSSTSERFRLWAQLAREPPAVLASRVRQNMGAPPCCSCDSRAGWETPFFFLSLLCTGNRGVRVLQRSWFMVVHGAPPFFSLRSFAVFQRKISRQERLGATISSSVDPQYPAVLTQGSLLHLLEGQ